MYMYTLYIQNANWDKIIQTQGTHTEEILPW